MDTTTRTMEKTPPRSGGERIAPRRALLLTAASAVLPGLAHLHAGRRSIGRILLGVHLCALATAVFAIIAFRGDLMQLAVRPRLLLALVVVSVLAAVAWPLLLVWSYSCVRPAWNSQKTRVTGAALVGLLGVVTAVPPLAVARYGYLQHDLITSVFTSGPQAGSAAGQGAPPAGTSLPPRLNVLLLGGDADVNRPGVRTDSMTLASVDTRTGGTVLISLPRNLQHVPVWNGHRRVRYSGKRLLNEVYEFGKAHPRLTGARNPGAELLKRTYGHIVGLPVHYYAMVDMRSFRQIVDAVHGVRLCVRQPIPVPREQVAGGVIEAGCQRLTGRQALWYGRSRTASSDYARMARQKCLMWALVHQADPVTVLRSFQRLTQVFKYSVNTDIPVRVLPSLLRLPPRIRQAGLHSVQFTPPLINTWRPDYRNIRTITSQALRSPVVVEKNLDQTCTEHADRR
ncbi:hypothetical protein Acsp03_00460 [Actinomadura sp. NBRC 104412]|uniref:LCP family protein n=1 Tax=Actinomadura sp. NBRC 104412 TaxID=3032203 RepID=UPI0024A44473|nr:LCP family protein [Actinomadura sp. NBRC 104412]GLZ02579.1 hypothetical protein Acsp03_00460 [Actinomadura sp. NBRC 104412]